MYWFEFGICEKNKSAKFSNTIHHLFISECSQKMSVMFLQDSLFLDKIETGEWTTTNVEPLFFFTPRVSYSTIILPLFPVIVGYHLTAYK